MTTNSDQAKVVEIDQKLLEKELASPDPAIRENAIQNYLSRGKQRMIARIESGELDDFYQQPVDEEYQSLPRKTKGQSS